MVVDPPQVVTRPGDLAGRAGALRSRRAVAGAERRERPVEREDVEAVPRQLEVADDLRPQERDDVAEDAEPEAGEQLLGDRGATEDVALLEDERLQAGAGEIGRADEPVVAAAELRVVTLGQAFLPETVARRKPEGSRASRAPPGGRSGRGSGAPPVPGARRDP